MNLLKKLPRSLLVAPVSAIEIVLLNLPIADHVAHVVRRVRVIEKSLILFAAVHLRERPLQASEQKQHGTLVAPQRFNVPVAKDAACLAEIVAHILGTIQ